MFHDIQIANDNRENLLLFDRHELAIRRGSGDSAEIVIYPCKTGRLSVRFAKEPYACKIYLADGTTKDIDLGYDDDWGNIRTMLPTDWFAEGKGETPDDWSDRIGWGNDDEGHREIVKVELLDGVPNSDATEIPLEEFKRDVADFIIYFEG